jgi:RNA polymerase sigma-70 factor, ECF subfamily
MNGSYGRNLYFQIRLKSQPISVDSAQRASGFRDPSLRRAQHLMAPEKRESLLQLASSGDADAFSALFREVRPRLVLYIQRHCPAKLAKLYDLDDILQDLLFESYRRIGQFVDRGDDALFRWMVTITRNRMLALLRAEEAEKRGGNLDRLSPSNDTDMSRLLETLAVYRRTPSQSAASHETMAALEQAISRLSEDHRRAITLRFLNGKSHEEVGELMERSPGAAKMLCHRALRELRREIGPASTFL